MRRPTPEALVPLAIFVAAVGLLFLEVFATRVISIAVGSRYVFYTIAIAMLGLGASSSAVSLLHRVDRERALSLASSGMLIAALGSLALFVGTAWYCSANNEVLDAFAGRPGEYASLSLAMDQTGIVVIGALMLIPYAAVGAVLAIVFRVAPPRLAGRWYGWDLLGACLGACLSIVALDRWSYTAAAVGACLLPVCGAAIFAWATGRRRALAVSAVAFVLVAALAGAASSARLLEPRPALSALARTWEEGGGARELWSTWTSYGRIAALDMQLGFDRSTLMAHGRGEGHARIVEPGQELSPHPIRLFYASKAAITACRPDRVLVLFAGAGADMRIIHHLTEGRARIRGVELVREVFEWPARRPELGVADFLSLPGVELVAAEAREFLARDDGVYDCILVSWFGASIGYLTGVDADATSSLYTVEGMTEVLRHLAPEGQLTILNGDKARLILTLLPALEAVGAPRPQASLLIMSSRRPTDAYDHSISDWLLVKPAGFSDQDVARLSGVTARPIITLDPGTEGEFHRELVRDPEGWARRIREEQGTDILPATDDRPFPHNLVPASALVSERFWRGDVAHVPRVIGRQWMRDREQFVATLGFVALSIALILGPVLLRRSGGTPWSGRAVNELVYFSGVGAGFMLVEMGLIQKLRLLVGHPGHTVAVVLASILLFTGIGSLVSNASMASGRLTIRRVALLAVAATMGTVVLFEATAHVLVGLPYAFKLMVAFLLPAIPCMLLGHLFPQGLAALGGGPLVPWAIAVNALTGTIMTGLGVFLGKHIGFRAVIGLGCIFYLLIAAIPQQRREQSLRMLRSGSPSDPGAAAGPTA